MITMIQGTTNIDKNYSKWYWSPVQGTLCSPMIMLRAKYSELTLTMLYQYCWSYN